MEKIIAHPSPWGGDTTALPKGYYYTLLGSMPGGYQWYSLQVLLRLFLQAQGHQEGEEGSEDTVEELVMHERNAHNFL